VTEEMELLFDLPPEITELETSDEALVIVNIEGVIVQISKPAQVLLGVTAEDAVGEFVEILMAKDMRWGHQAYRRGYQAEPTDREMDPDLGPNAQLPDGTLLPIHIRLQPIRVATDLYVVAHVTER
jgi:PAS domain S-box-containing protein